MEEFCLIQLNIPIPFEKRTSIDANVKWDETIHDSVQTSIFGRSRFCFSSAFDFCFAKQQHKTIN